MEIKKENLDNIVTYIKEHIITPGAGVYIEMIEKAVHEIAANDGIEYLLALRDAVSERLTGPERGDGAYLHFVDLVDDKWANPPETQQTAAIDGASGPQPGQATDTKPEPKGGQSEGNETATRLPKYRIAYGNYLSIAEKIFKWMKFSYKKNPALADDCVFSTFLAAIETADFRQVHFENKIKFLYGLSKIAELVWPSDWKSDLEPLKSPGKNGRAWDWKKEWDYLRRHKNAIEVEWKYVFDSLIEDIKNRKF